MSQRRLWRGASRGQARSTRCRPTITNLQSDTTYRWVLCGSPNDGAAYGCVGPQGQVSDHEGCPTAGLREVHHRPPSGALSEGWDGTSWATRATPNPTGAADSHLSGISCTSATACTAVGNYIDGAVGGSGTEVPLAERWNGTAWKIQPMPNPAGAQSSDLTEDLVHVRDRVHRGRVTTKTAMRSGRRSPSAGTAAPGRSSPRPARRSAQSSELSGISCTSATACTAVGHYSTHHGRRYGGAGRALERHQLEDPAHPQPERHAVQPPPDRSLVHVRDGVHSGRVLRERGGHRR